MIGGIIDAIGKNVKADIRMSREKSVQDQRSYDQFMQDKYNTVQAKVAQAKDAGVHPLFALGAGGSWGGGISSGSGGTGQPGASSGNVGAAIDAMIQGKARKQRQSGMDANLQRMQDAQIRNLDARSALGEQEFARLDSDNAMNVRDPWDTGPRAGAGNSDFAPVGVVGAEERTFPPGSTRPLKDRPVTMTTNRSIPLRQTVIGDDGYKYRPITDEAGDELAWVDLFQQMVLRYTRRARRAPGRELKIQMGRAASKALRARKSLSRRSSTRRSNRYRIEQRTWRGRR